MSLESGALKANYIDAFAVMFLLSLPISVGLYLVADLLIEVVFGPQWLAAVPLLKILACLGIVQSFGANTHLVLNRIGRPRLTAVAGMGYLIVLVPALFWATVKYGVHGTAWAIVLSSGLMVLTEYSIMRHVLRVRFGEMFAHVWRPLLAAAFMAQVIVMARSSLHPVVNFSSVTGLAGIVVLGAVIYGGAILVAWWLSRAGPGAERHILQTISRAWPRRRFVGTTS